MLISSPASQSKSNPRGIRTPNLLIRSQTRYPLRHEAAYRFFHICSFSSQLSYSLPKPFYYYNTNTYNNKYKEGDYFGERALIKGEPRYANIVAKSELVKVISLDRDSFKRLLGPIEEILKRNMDKYQTFIVRGEQQNGEEKKEEEHKEEESKKLEELNDKIEDEDKKEEGEDKKEEVKTEEPKGEEEKKRDEEDKKDEEEEKHSEKPIEE